MNYDFSQLNDKEFEGFVINLLSIAYNVRIERFKGGKDSGIDGRFFVDNDNEVCVQCKHYLKSGYRSLVSKLKKDELKKVKLLKPKRYVFVTSLPLSRKNKEEIKSIFSPFIIRSDDIFGQEDLNDLLMNNPSVEEKYFKLWISSTNVFNRIINNAIKGRSEFEIEQIRNKSFKYIKTNVHDKALKMLNEKHVLLISGEPGIGKTTLAENLCLFFASKDYEFIDIEESLSEAENVYDRGKKQIFYFDDFLGSNYFEAIENKKDSHVAKFIERIRHDKTKRFILTSRTNILNSGILYSSIFANKNIRDNECMLTIEKITKFDRAKILYNHIWFSDLDEDLIEEYYKEKRYRIIIDHQNFNPRLIEFISDAKRIDIDIKIDYWNYILQTLDNPKDIWNDCFKIQNDAYVRNLVKIVVFNGGVIEENELRKSFHRLNRIENLRNISHTEKDFQTISRLATKSFLNRNKHTNRDSYTLFNPSIADYVFSEYCGDFGSISAIFKSLETSESLEHLLAMERGNIISKNYVTELKKLLFDDAISQNKKPDYLICISYLLREDDDKKDPILNLLRMTVEKPTPIDEISKFLDLISLNSDELGIDDYSFLLCCIDDKILNESEIKDFAVFLENFEIEDAKILKKLEFDLFDSLVFELDSMKNDIDVSRYISYDYDNDGGIDIAYNDGIENELLSIAENIIKGFNSKIILKLNITYSEIIENIDIDQMIDDYISSQSEPDYEPYHAPAGHYDYDIDDLFERT